MNIQNKKSLYKKLALTLSLCALIVWGVLGAGASLAWFTDTSTEINNIFHIAEFELNVWHYDEGQWKKVDGQTKIFDDEALFEPGYVQVVYLKIKNDGTVPFNLSMAVNVNGCVEATNVFGQRFMLQDYLKFGIINDIEEQDIIDGKLERETAENATNMSLKDIADMPLHNYATETTELGPGETNYVALVVRMPEEVDNVANYRGETVPKVELGITVKADQIRK